MENETQNTTEKENIANALNNNKIIKIDLTIEEIKELKNFLYEFYSAKGKANDIILDKIYDKLKEVLK